MFLANSYPNNVGLHFIKVCTFFSEIRYLAILSISAGGQPWSVDKHILLHTLGEILSMSSAVTFLNRYKFSFKNAILSFHISVFAAYLSPSI